MVKLSIEGCESYISSDVHPFQIHRIPKPTINSENAVQIPMETIEKEVILRMLSRPSKASMSRNKDRN